MMYSHFLKNLRHHYGTEAALSRHEVYFLSQRPLRLLQCVRSMLAAVRDALMCACLPVRRMHLPEVVTVVTLTGSSGIGALTSCLQALERRGLNNAIIIHPRLRRRVRGQLPNRPALINWQHALSAFWLRFPNAKGSSVPALLVRCCIFRQRLWRGVWLRTLGTLDKPGVLLLHNDFDVFSVAAIEAGRNRWRSICMQHGLPTDEFFPPNANRQIVWGASSAQAYMQLGFQRDTLLFGPRVARICKSNPASVPNKIYLISQTHTPIFGRSLQADFLSLAKFLQARLDGNAPLAILLHPEEVRNTHPYQTPALRAICSTPPHDVLNQPMVPALIVGFCSTALLYAACRGHLVIGLNWLVSASQAALFIGQPFNRVANTEALLEMLEQLLTSPVARERYFLLQNQWLKETFNESEDWLAWIESCQ